MQRKTSELWRRMSLLCGGKLSFVPWALRRYKEPWSDSARITYLAEGDANTKFFDLQACHRNRKGHIPKLKTGDTVLFRDEEMAKAVFEYFDSMLGTPGQ